MPRLVSAGIWKDVYLEKIKPTYISDFYLTTRAINGNNAFLQASYEITSLNAITNNGRYSIEIIGALDNHVFTIKKDVYSKSNVIKFNVENAKLWWPKGAGEQNLYLVTVNLYENDVIIDKYVINFGIRTVNLSLVDEFGNDDFTFIVNGEKLYMRGANHVPLSPLHSEDLARTEKAFEIINDYQMNMVRLWGGNVYESNLFYDLADKNGVLIWQDFTFGCATYPQNETFFNKVKFNIH
jgi:beta-mannosidase